MKCMTYKHYGGPHVIEIIEKDMPSIGPHEVLVKIIASSINAADYDLLAGTLYGRLSGLRKPKYQILGSDLAGIVVNKGHKVSDFVIGDRVFGDMSEEGFGTFAEYKAVHERALVKIPDDMTYLDAAALPSAAVIALQAFNNKRPLSNGKLLLNGAGGGMGSYALKIAKLKGIEVTAIDNAFKLDHLKALGADITYDYNQVKYHQLNESFDRIIDCHAVYSSSKIKKVLKDDGICYVIGGKASKMINIGLKSLFSKSDQYIGLLLAKFNAKLQMEEICDYYTNHQIKPVIDKVYALDELAEAFRRFESKKFIGKIVIEIQEGYEYDKK